MENEQKILSEEEMKEIREKGWKNVVIDERQPLGAVIDFFNILNQRLAFIEDIIHFNSNGRDMTISQYYQEQQELALKQMQEQQIISQYCQEQQDFALKQKQEQQLKEEKGE